MALAMVNCGDTCRIINIRAKDNVKRHLQNLGFLVGEQVKVLEDNANGIIISVKGSKIALNRGLASQIIVEC